MKSTVLNPTKENILDTFSKDSLKRNVDLVQFIKMLWSIEGHFSIAVDGRWGSGKTFFIKQCKAILESYIEMSAEFDINEKEEIKKIFSRYAGNQNIDVTTCLPIYYDAWANDNDIDPVLSIAYEIEKTINDVDYFVENSNIGKTLLKVFDAFAKTNTANLLDIDRTEDLLEEIKNQRCRKEKICNFLEVIRLEKAERIVIFIDELDRCKPDYAVKLLERIKHYFENDNVTFVFSVNLTELQHTIKKYYGDNFDATRYINRFFDIIIPLPPVSIDKIYDIQDSYLFNANNKKIGKICKYFGFQMREISKYVSYVKFTDYEIKNSFWENTKNLSYVFCLKCVVPIMIGLRIYDMDMYYSLKSGKDDRTFIDILSDEEIFGGFYRYFLNKDETYNDEDGMKTVKVTEKLHKIYEYLFVFNYDSLLYNDSFYVGCLEFDIEIRNKLFKLESLFDKEAEILYTNDKE